MQREVLGDGFVAAVAAIAAAAIAAISLSARDSDPTIVVGSLIVGGVFVLGVLALRRIEWFLAVVIAIRPSLDKLDQEDLGIVQPVSTLGLLLIAVCLAWLVGAWFGGTFARPSTISKVFIVYAAAITCSAPASLIPVVSATGAVKLWSAAILFVTLEQLHRTRPRFIWTLLGAGALGVIIPVATAYVQAMWTGEIEPISGVPRVDGTFVHPNPFATYLVVIFLVAAAVAIRSSGSLRVAGVGVMVIVGPAVLLSYARAGWGSLIAGMALIAWRWDRRIFGAIVLTGFLAVVANPTIVTRLADLTAEDDPTLGYENPNSMEWRVGYWVEIMPLGLANPATGIGLDMVERVTDDALPPHNTYVQAFVEAGLLGLGGLLTMSVATWRLVRRSLNAAFEGEGELIAVAFAAAGLSIFLQMFTENLLTGVIPIWYLTIGLTWLAARGPQDPLPAPMERSTVVEHRVGV